jgi:hypothetical protein
MLTWNKDRTRAPVEKIQLKADCFLNSLSLHARSRQRSGSRDGRFGQQKSESGEEAFHACCSLEG